MRNSAKIAIGAVVVVALGALVLPRFLKPKEQSEAVAPPVVRVEHPVTGTIELSTGLIGKVEPSDLVYIIPKVGGEVTEVLVKPGDVVTEGQLICKIDTKQVDSAKLNLDAAEIALNDARTNLARMQVLYQSGDISAQAFEQVQSGAKSAQIQYDGAKLAYDLQLENSEITAPIAGVVESVDMNVHDLVSQQNLICVISGEGSKAISFSVTERVAEELQEGDEIRVEKNGGDYQGSITEVSSMVDAATGLFKVKASVADGDALATGTSVKLYVISEKEENAMTLPIDAIYYEGGDAFVYTYDRGIVHKVPVTTGISDAENIQVLTGLTMEDQVITTWSPELYEGAPADLAKDQMPAGEKTSEAADAAETTEEPATEVQAQ